MSSPCVKICKLVDGVCIGCNRTIQQITEHGKKKNLKANKESTMSDNESLDSQTARLADFILDFYSEAIQGQGAIDTAISIIKKQNELLKPFADFANMDVPRNLVITQGSEMAKRQLTMADCVGAKFIFKEIK